MRIVADLHVHSPFARACSKDITLETLVKYARLKGIDLLGTGDFTHPTWMANLKAQLTEDGSGILRGPGGFPFLLQTEVANIFSQGGRVRKVHNLILAPSFEVADQVNAFLGTKGSLKSDGRPMLGKMTCAEMVEQLKEISPEIEIICAHAWTPWFGVFGSMSGFDSLKECFQDQTKHIKAIETGLSSNPAMNWRLSQLDSVNLVSFSDLHSAWPWRLGREATILELPKLSYGEVRSAIADKGSGKLVGTIECDPAYGKYHIDGHRACGISLEPAESRKLGGICPKCNRPLTIGVLARVEQLADRAPGYIPKDAPTFHSLIPLTEVIQARLNSASPLAKKVWEQYTALVSIARSELDVLLRIPEEELLRLADARVVQGILTVRSGKLEILPGFDGIYGLPVFEPADREKPRRFDPEPKPKSPTAAGNARPADPPAKRRGRPPKPTGQRTLGAFGKP